MAARKKTTKTEKPELKTGTLHLEWFPAYGVRIKEMPHLVVIGKTEAEALQNLATLGYQERRLNSTDYNMVFLNDVFEID